MKLTNEKEEVEAMVRLCNEKKVPIIPRGAGTGLEGGCVPYQGGVVCDTSTSPSRQLILLLKLIT